MNDLDNMDGLLDAVDPGTDIVADARAPRRDLPALMRKISVTLTLEVGEARISLHELAQLQADSVVELDTLAGAPLTLKVNGTPIGRAEVVVSGDSHALKIVEIDGLDLDQLGA
ncbi:MAG: FliM/FliN family flagellar motor switch protein [Paucibacter sp.]|nr:FliM/FliN family flagellar motor switch protein [Roseateles sp.]